MISDTTPLFQMPKGIQTRWASPENWEGEKGVAAQSFGGRKGSPSFFLKAGGRKVLAEVSGSGGTVRRIWATIDDRSPKMMRGLRLDMYWDGAEKPAVSAPLGDFFGQGLGRATAFESALFSNPEGRSFNCCIPMPFKSGMKIVASNESDTDLAMFYYDVDYTLDDPHGDDTLYLHAHWRRENPTKMQEDYAILPKVEGRGRFLGVNVGVIADAKTYFKSWWGEGEIKIYLDGDEELPTLCGTGTEDYIGTAWGLGCYSNLYQGAHVADSTRFQFCFYRYHILDPVYFYRDIRVTMQQIGCWDPTSIQQMREAGVQLVAGADRQVVDMNEPNPFGLFERQDDWSSCAYFYLDRPTDDLPPLAAPEERINGLLGPSGAPEWAV